MRLNRDDLMREATHALSLKTGSLAVATIEGEGVWSYGHSFLFTHPQLFDMQVCYNLFVALEEQRRLEELFLDRLTGMNPIEVLFGEELGRGYLDPIGIVASRFNVGNKVGAIGIIGPFGLHYPSIIPTVRYFGSLLKELTDEQTENAS